MRGRFSLSQPRAKSTYWIPPGSGRCKINADAAIAKADYKGCVGVI